MFGLQVGLCPVIPKGTCSNYGTAVVVVLDNKTALLDDEYMITLLMFKFSCGEVFIYTVYLEN